VVWLIYALIYFKFKKSSHALSTKNKKIKIHGAGKMKLFFISIMMFLGCSAFAQEDDGDLKALEAGKIVVRVVYNAGKPGTAHAPTHDGRGNPDRAKGPNRPSGQPGGTSGGFRSHK